MNALFEQDPLRVRLLHASDLPLLERWLSDPQVLTFYGGRDQIYDEVRIRQKFFADRGDLVGCIVEYNAEPIGYLQFYPVDEQGKAIYGYTSHERVYGTDQFIGEPAYWNHGLGTCLMQATTNYLFQHVQADNVVLDPHTDNARAIRAYEKSGFTRIKILSRHEMHEGMRKDCWLMALDRADWEISRMAR